MSTLLARRSAIVGGSVSVLLLALVTAERLAGSGWPCAWLGLEIVLLVGRLALVERTRTRLTRGEFRPFQLYAISATVWCMLLGLGAWACVRTGDVVLVVLAAITIAGVAAGISTLSAAFPRLATFQIVLVGMPYTLGAAWTPSPWSAILTIDIALLLVVMSSLTHMHHSDRVNLIRAERTNWFLASHDSLTGLPNRSCLFERLAALCTAASTGPGAGSSAVLCLDLDGFKAVNDTFGHPVGDQLLIVVAQRLAREIRGPDIVARTGGDEFIIVLQDVDDEGAARTSQRIIAAIARPIALGGATDLLVSATIGSALAPRDAVQAELLISRADQALYAAKRAQRGVYRTYAELAHPVAGKTQASEAL